MNTARLSRGPPRTFGKTTCSSFKSLSGLLAALRGLPLPPLIIWVEATCMVLFPEDVPSLWGVMRLVGFCPPGNRSWLFLDFIGWAGRRNCASVRRTSLGDLVISVQLRSQDSFFDARLSRWALIGALGSNGLVRGKYGLETLSRFPEYRLRLLLRLDPWWEVSAWGCAFARCGSRDRCIWAYVLTAAMTSSHFLGKPSLPEMVITICLSLTALMKWFRAIWYATSPFSRHSLL
ncbi:hypothetical protein Hanom_Chr09g00850281 [Helianthus anomalus]